MTSLSVADEPVYLSSLIADQTGCGSYDFPWRLTALPAGRRLRVWLLDYSRRDEPHHGPALQLSPAEGLKMCQVRRSVILVIIKFTTKVTPVSGQA